jgi:hypothetical protein
LYRFKTQIAALTEDYVGRPHLIAHSFGTRPRHERHTTPARIARFYGGPLTPPALVEFDGDDDLIFAANPSHLAHRAREGYDRIPSSVQLESVRVIYFVNP